MTNVSSSTHSGHINSGRPLQFNDRFRRYPLMTIVIAVGLSVVVVIVSGAAAFLVSAAGTRVYAAQVDLVVEADPALSDDAANRLRATQKVTLSSPTVLEPVAASVDVAVEDLERSVSVAEIQDSNVLRLTVSNPDPQKAKATAQLITDEYQRYVNRQTSGTSQPKVQVLTRAHVLDEPIKPKPVSAAVAGAVVGVILGVGVAYALLRFASRR
jgi:capsular polysaccharide biosynthesis protein